MIPPQAARRLRGCGPRDAHLGRQFRQQTGCPREGSHEQKQGKVECEEGLVDPLDIAPHVVVGEPDLADDQEADDIGEEAGPFVQARGSEALTTCLLGDEADSSTGINVRTMAMTASLKASTRPLSRPYRSRSRTEYSREGNVPYLRWTCSA